jgi:uncharacterized protein YkwD
MKRVFAVAVVMLAMSGQAWSADFASQLNAYRRAHGLPPVRMDSRLSAVAMQQARAMAAGSVVNHTAGGPFTTRIAKLRVERAAENVAAGFLTSAETLKQWEDSAGHRENLLMPGARRVGIASVDNPRSPYRKFWAMLITD